ncbi:glycoside hydrolase family 27 protein [uncultured Sunxiuqinia sp.]|uniref:glycoside hydrolase family 27 protein n=1 Tax=uncultured Sunxiuqinia sp. TaxID=1573825 RepID=UPI002637FD67|nr:glycoside hydrolase family 27 protein [uncultured Sunxiuqinia sp.]
MKHYYLFIFAFSLLFSCTTEKEVQTHPQRPQTPIMGWASWNNYRVNINEEIIRNQADAMVNRGLSDVGYHYLNVDDGYFGGRDSEGNIVVHPERFPSGMKSLADYIHSRGLKAGIYSDAGINTCASYWDKDTIGVGMGLYNHEWQDLTLMLKDWGYDFIKVDWCGGDWLQLDEQTRYTEIGSIIRTLRPDVVYNICRWEFPGEWAVQVADSWRISGDINNTFGSVMHIVDLNADLWRFSGPGHFNDMDMLQVGRGMTYEEDKTHFTMWCIMNSPLLAGNDLTTMSDETLSILTNEEVIALNQDPFAYQARRLEDHGDLELWAKPLVSAISGQVGVALLNRSNEAAEISLNLETIGIRAKDGYSVRDLWEKTTQAELTADSISFKVPAHGVVALRVEGTSIPYNVFQQ